MLNNVTYYTLSDLERKFFPLESTTLYSPTALTTRLSNLDGLLAIDLPNEKLFGLSTTLPFDASNTDIIAMYKFICGKHTNDYIAKIINPEAYSSSDLDKELLYQFTLFYRHLINIITITASRYTTLLQLYRSKQNALLDKISNTQSRTTKRTDTPETPSPSYTDPFINAVDTEESTYQSDVNTVMARLKEIQDSYMNLLGDWESEFEKLFILIQ